MQLDLTTTQSPRTPPTRIEASAPGSTMRRPRETDEAIALMAAREFAPACAKWDPESTSDDWIEPLYAARHHWDDGYRLASHLEDRAHVAPDAALVEILDDATDVLRRVHEREVRAWVRIVGFTPIHAVGDQVRWPRGSGTVTAIEVETARYVVSTDGRTRGGVLVDAEIVRAASDPS